MMLQMRDCCKGFIKGLLMGLNGTCVLIAIFMIACYIIDARIIQQYGESHVKETIMGDIFMVVTCICLITVACFGIVGAAKENVKFLYWYMIQLIMLMVMELMLSILVSLFRYGMQFSVTNWLREDFFKNVTGNELQQHTELWQRLQSQYECCGLNGPEDYFAMRQKIDMACCEQAYNARTDFAKKQLYKTCIITSGYYQHGCEEEILYYIQTGNEFLLLIATVSFSLETMGILMAMWLANNLKNEVQIYKETVRY